MARFKIQLGGVVVETDDAVAVRELLLEGNRGADKPTKQLTDEPNAAMISGSPQHKLAYIYDLGSPVAIRFMKKVKESGGGISSKKLMKDLGYRQTRGIGNVARALRLACNSHKIDLDQVVISSVVNGQRLWFPGPRIDEIIKKIGDARQKAVEEFSHP